MPSTVAGRRGRSAITGKPAGNYTINSTNLASDWNSGDLIVLVTSSPRSSYIFPSTLRHGRLQRGEQRTV